ncbi:PQQ-dependent sugar dehydrogenase [Sorangium sp. So ce1078]|uniref:PQQ-dependent sugar dehydrogenase n=1 Tax=Sorangium sp. So ce1078 TaxID=3133329 RepID=UPI003F5F6334
MRQSNSALSPLLVIALPVAAGLAFFACARDESLSPLSPGAGGGASSVASTGGPGGSGAGGSGEGGGSAGKGGAGGEGAGRGGAGQGGGGGSGAGGGGAGQGGGGGSGEGEGGGGAPVARLSCSPPTEAEDEGSLKLTPVVTGLRSPLLVKSAPGDPTRLFIVTQPGQILVLDEGATEPTTFLDIRDLVFFAGDERGLLGLAFHPEYESNGRFFVHYSDKATAGDTRVVEFARGERPDVASPTPVATYLEQAQPQRNHNGGSLEFSPIDGFLYLGLGDGGNSNDYGPGHSAIGNGQDLTTLLGKILRFDVSTHPYRIPEGNMTGEGVLPEIWDYGLRNPYRFSFDACTGDLYIADVGQRLWEEINIEPAGQGRKNYGWRLMEAAHCFQPVENCDPSGITTPPAAEYAHAGRVVEDCSVTGGYVYRGSRIPWLRGSYLFGDYCSGRIWTLTYEGGVASAPVDRTDDLGSFGLKVASFGQDGTGEVYVMDFVGDTVYRIDPE